MVKIKDISNKDGFLVQSVGFFILALASVVFMTVLYFVSFDISGPDSWGHVFKAHELVDSIRSGDLYPLYTSRWYNGFQTFRQWGPISYYILAAFIVISRGNVHISYILYITSLYCLGGIPWIIWGNIQKRRVRGSLFAVLWIFLPGILKVYIGEGNVPQMLAAAITPYLLLFVWLYIRKEKKWAIFGIYITMFLISFIHLMVTAIVGISFFLYLLIDGITQKTWKRGMISLASMVSGILTAGIWVVPAVISNLSKGGIGTGDIFLLPMNVVLNPLYRFLANEQEYYFGLFIVIACIFGLLFSKDRKIAGFVVPLIILFLTSPSIYKLISILPLVKDLWVSRFAPVMYYMFFSALLEWTSIKKKYSGMIYGLIVADILPSFFLGFYYEPTDKKAFDYINQLRNMTEHRASVLDLSKIGSYPAYALGAGEDGVDYSFGWAYQGSEIRSNIVLINAAMESGNYLYVFDRSIELGDDAVIVPKTSVLDYNHSFDDLLVASSTLGFEYKGESGDCWFFQKEYPDEFGVINYYYGLAIGKYAPEMTITYPSFIVSSSQYIDDYSFEELINYDVIFLSGFKYHDKNNAESLVQSISRAGVRVVIDSSHMPSDIFTKNEEFLGVLNQRIEFVGHYPTLHIGDNDYVLGSFSSDDMSFTTGYISNIDNCLGSFNYDNKELSFYGTVDGIDNVYFVALNLMYYVTTTKDETALSILDEVIGIPSTVLPVRRVVPIEIDYSGNQITIVSPEDNVNTTLAYMDIFDSIRDIRSEFNLLVVDEGTTVINMHYPCLKLALATTAFGIVLMGVILFLEKRILEGEYYV